MIKTIVGGPSDFGIGWIIILASSFVTIVVALIGVFHWVRSKVNEKKVFYRKAHQLAIGMDIRNFENTLGHPVFVNTLDEGLTGHDEYVFSNKYFYTQAVVNVAKQVVLFSVTARVPNFKPTFKIGGSDLAVTLCKTRFSDIGLDPEKTFAHPDHGGIGFYSEIYYLGRPGHYLNHAISLNFNGPTVFDYIADSFTDDLNKKPSETFRANTPINTYTVIGTSVDSDQVASLILGPRTGQIWNLND